MGRTNPVKAGIAVDQRAWNDLREKRRKPESTVDAVGNEAMYRSMMEATDDLIYVCSADFRIEYMNRAMAERTGRDATGERCYAALHDREDVCPWCANAIVQKGESHRWEVTSPKDNRTFHISNVPLLRQDGSVSKLAVIRDITETKATEQAVRESQDRLKLALDASEMGVWEWDVETDEIFWSPECHAILGLESSTGTLEAFTNVLHAEDAARVMAAARKALAEGTVYKAEFRIIRSDGETRWVSNLGRGTYDENGKPLRLVGTVQDITERTRAEEDLKRVRRAFVRCSRICFTALRTAE